MSPALVISAFWLILFLTVAVLVVLVVRRDRRELDARDVPSGPRVRVEQRRGQR